MKEILIRFLEEQRCFVNFENYKEPDFEIREGEKVIGEMNDYEKYLWSLLYKKEKENIDLIERAFGEIDFNKRTSLLIESKQKNMLQQMIYNMAFASIYSRFKISLTSKEVGVRKGFKIVEIFETKHPLSILDFMEM
jgi:hypothetical protein